MKEKYLLLALIMFAVQLAVSAQDADKKTNTQPASPAGKCYAVLVGGTPGSPMYSARYQDWLKRFKAHLVGKGGVPAENIAVLSADPAFKEAVQITKGSEDVAKAISVAGGKCGANDQFILFMAGHGYSMEPEESFALPVKDLRPAELRQMLAGVKSRRQLILNFSTSSGAFLGAIAGTGRINITATNGSESNAPVFAEFFLHGIESGRADGEGGAKDGKVSVLEAYNWATFQTAEWTVRQMADGEEWTVEGKETCEIFKKLYVFPDDPEGKKMSAKSKPEAPDAIYGLKIIVEGQQAEVDASKKFWNGRRGILEHALLEDCGESVGLGALNVPENNKRGYAPIVPASAKDPGYLSSKTFIGQAK